MTDLCDVCGEKPREHECVSCGRRTCADCQAGVGVPCFECEAQHA